MIQQISLILLTCFFISESFAQDTSSYNRHDWPHWSDLDKDGQDSRVETLINESRSKVYFTTDKGRKSKVKSGLWVDPYSKMVIRDARRMDIDHIVPLKHAHENGASAWSREAKKEFANDPENLIAVWFKPNRIKGAKGPMKWKPHISYWCEYAKRWMGLKNKYDLQIAEEETIHLQVMLETCKYNLKRVPKITK